MTMAARIAAEGRRGRILFPLQPKEHESFQGYIVRVAEWNAFKCPDALANALGIRPTSNHQWYKGVDGNEHQLSRQLGVEPLAIEKMLSITDPDRNEYIRSECPYRRISPSAVRKERYHREYWCASRLEFCPESWEYLVSKCPSCGRHLRWSALSIDQCGRCLYDLKCATSLTVPEKMRPSLRFMADLINRDFSVRELAKRKTPHEFQSVSPIIIFDLAVLFGRAACGDADVAGGDQFSVQAHASSVLSEGAKILLRYPVSVQGVLDSKINKTTPEFFKRLRRFSAGKSAAPTFLAGLLSDIEPIVHGPSRLRRNRDDLGQLTLREAAERLGIQNAQVRLLMMAELMSASQPRGAQRTCQWFAPDEVERVRKILANRVSEEHASRTLGLPIPGIHQLEAAGLLNVNSHRVVDLIYRGRHLYLAEIDQLMDALKGRLRDPSGLNLKLLSLEETFYGVGAQPKPWLPLISGVLDGRIPAYFGVGNPLQIKSLRIHTELAERIVRANGAEFLQVAACASVDASTAQFYSRTDAENYLNCYPRDFTWLKTHGHISVSAMGIDACGIESLGKELISSREIIWRWRVSPSLRDSLASDHGIHRVMGPFWPRAAVENHFSKLFGHGGRIAS